MVRLPISHHEFSEGRLELKDGRHDVELVVPHDVALVVLARRPLAQTRPRTAVVNLAMEAVQLKLATSWLRFLKEINGFTTVFAVLHLVTLTIKDGSFHGSDHLVQSCGN